ncbi:MAG: GtrA family protein [Patescibacteria group bacterium]
MLEKNRLYVKNNIQIINYIFFAGTATVVDVGLLYVLTDMAGLKYLISSVISYCAGMVVNYSLNKLLNFKDRNKKIFRQFSIFFAVALIGLLFNQLIIVFLVELFKIWYMIAKIISVLLVMIWSFWAHKNITFKSC